MLETPSPTSASRELVPAPTVDDLYALLRAEILSGELPAGSVVSQVKLAERLGVNRTPLREALRMLQRDGLVTGEHNRRVRVADLSCDDLVQLYALRISQESLAIRLTVSTLGADELEELDSLLAEMDEHGSPRTFPRWEQAHRRFHQVLVSHAGDRITSSVGDLSDYCERYRRELLEEMPAGFGIGAREHATIVEHCRNRDAEAASTALARHLARTALTLVSAHDPGFDPAPVRQALRLVTGEASEPRPNVAG